MGMAYSKSAAGRLDTGFDLRKPNRKVGGDEVGGHGIDDFWVNFRQEDGMNGILDDGWWMLDWQQMTELKCLRR